MIMTIKQLAYALSCFLLFFSSAIDLRGQVKDFQSWWELELDKKVTGRLDLSGELEQRFKNNSLQYSRTLLTIGASYDLAAYLELAGGARMVLLRDAEQQFHTRYRFHMDGTGNYDLSGFDLSLRVRLQYGFDDIQAFRYLRFNSLVNRNRLKVAQHIFGTRFGWFASVESWHGSGIESQWLTYAIRYSAGLRFSPSFTSRFSLRYILEDEFNVTNPMLLNALVLGYSYRF
jgi:hypothetical protein